MVTPKQLSADLARLSICRDLRVLVDWRQKGLLPPLRQVGLGRGKGTKQVWDKDVLDQAIAVHLLLSRYARSNEALLGLWFAGYTVSCTAAQKAWIDHLKSGRERREKAASQYKDNYFGLGRSWWQRLPKRIRDLAARDDLIVEMPEWLDDKSERNDEAYRNAITEFINFLAEPHTKDIPSDELYEIVDTLWDEIDPATLFKVDRAIDFVQSMSESELNTANQSLSAIRQIIQHAMELNDRNIDRVTNILVPVRLMQGLIGLPVAMALTSLHRRSPILPLSESIATIHSFVMSVKLEDLSKQNKNGPLVSQRVCIEWETVKRNLAQLWNFELEDSPK